MQSNKSSYKMTGFIRVAHWFSVDEKNQPIGKCNNAGCTVDAYDAKMDRNCCGGKIAFTSGQPFVNKTVYQSNGKTVIEVDEDSKKLFEEFMKQRKLSGSKREGREDESKFDENFFSSQAPTQQ